MTVENIQNSIYARLADSSSFYLVCLDTSGCYAYVNPNFAQKLSHVTAKPIGLHHHETIHPEDTTLTQGGIEACLALPNEVFTIRVRIPNGEGAYGWSHWEISAYQNDAGDPEGIICAGYDISLSESLNREALWHAKKLDNIIEHITDGFLIIDREWKFVKVNKIFEQILKVSREQILGKCIWDVFPDNAKHQYPAAYRKAAQENVATSFIDYNEENRRWYEGRVYPSTEGLTVIFRDITEKKMAEEKIRKSKNKLSAILDSTMDINLLLSPDYHVLSFNRKAYESMKVYFENLRLAPGQNILDYILPGTETDFKKNFQAALHGRTVEVKIKLFFKPGLAL
ncbi:MAG: PAS domain-containing protein, partial [Bacteroidetes bacterium]|nr:PAS domain-containing protein [Bacteroidota bacterium]